MVAIPEIIIRPQSSGLEAVRDFTDAASAFGLRLSGMAVADDQIHRVPDGTARGKNTSGWYVLSELDGILYGSFGSWKAGRGQQVWCSRDNYSLTVSEKQSLRAARERQAAEIEARRLEAAAQAEEDIEAAELAVDDHPYLQAKGVLSHGLLLQDDKLLLPIIDASGV